MEALGVTRHRNWSGAYAVMPHSQRTQSDPQLSENGSICREAAGSSQPLRLDGRLLLQEALGTREDSLGLRPQGRLAEDFQVLLGS